MAKVSQLIGRAFFGKSNCLKAYLNSNKEFFLEFGKKENDSWTWKKVKMNDVELGDIVNVLEGKKESTSFYHDFKGEKTQIWVNRKEGFIIKVPETAKGLNEGEETVLRELLKYSIMRMNLKL